MNEAALLPPHAAWQPLPDHVPAAVLVPLVEASGGAQVLFIKRHAGLRHHAGQYAFPGGQRDGDEPPVACALREFEEELGLPRAAVRVLGGLPCHASSAGFLVHPILGLLPDTTGLRADPGEVALVVEVPLPALRDAARWQWRTVAGPSGPRRSPFFTHGDHVIWGLTARIARDLVDALPGDRLP